MEDKIVQHAVVTILNNIYEEDFLGFLYGFRLGRSQHKALDGLSYALVKKKVNYVLDADIQGFFDNLDKAWMIKFAEHRVADQSASELALERFVLCRSERQRHDWNPHTARRSCLRR